MFLEYLLETELVTASRNIVHIVIQQMNLLLCLVNDMLDLKSIEQGNFISHLEDFSPIETIKFIMSIFKK